MKKLPKTEPVRINRDLKRQVQEIINDRKAADIDDKITIRAWMEDAIRWKLKADSP